jgi:hypothetical protein
MLIKLSLTAKATMDSLTLFKAKTSFLSGGPQQ